MKERIMHRFCQILAAPVAALFILTASAQAEDPAVNVPAIDPGAIQALNQMGSYLRALGPFRVESSTTRETVLEDGQKIQYEGNVDVLVRFPDGLRIHVTNDRHERLYLFNGKQFTMWGQRLNYYATVDAPATVGLLSSSLEENYGISLPLQDLFQWGTENASTAAITAAKDLGASVVGGTTCNLYAFRQEGVDWQVWIQKGNYPLPRKLVITTLTDEARPQYSATYRWDLAPSFNDSAFTFDPPADALRVVLENKSLSPDGSDE
jgi:hypothetical protein